MCVPTKEFVELVSILHDGRLRVGIVANKFSGIRAATCENIIAARCARAVNNSNVLCLGQLVTAPDAAKTIVDEFLGQDFISHPRGENGEPVSWWNGDVEKFLASSMEGVTRVENEASNAAKK